MFHVRHAAHPMMPVEERGLIIEGVNDQEVCADVRANGSGCGISQEARAEPVSLKSPVYGSTAPQDKPPKFQTSSILLCFCERALD